jgi:phospholipase C
VKNKLPESESGFNSLNLTRRRLLKTAAAGAALAAASALMPPNLRRALAAQPPREGSIRDIKHVVLLMQENRSFDHYFGTMAGVRGFADANAHRLPDGKSVFCQPDAAGAKGYLMPFHLDTKKTNAQKLPSTSHAWAVQHAAWNGGKMDKWLEAHRKADGVNGPFVMGYHTRTDIPFQFALAEAFTICDAYHCSMMGPTWPNRLYWMTGMVDPEGTHGGPIINNKIPKVGHTWTTYAERLEKAGVSWKVYQQEDNFGCNLLETFQSFRDAKPGEPLYEKGMKKGGPDQFEQDCLHDRLPAVSWIIPTGHESEHPNHMPAAGAAFVARQIDAIASNPEVWAKTAFILDYDENDGIFDHVVPPTPPPGTAGEFIKGLPIGGGFRVPCIIVSPWTAGGWVCSQPFDHTSVLQFLEKFTGVKEENITDWRRQTFGDLTAAFRFNDEKASPPKKSLARAIKGLVSAKHGADTLPMPPIPAGFQELPAQEHGTRKRVPKAQT